MLHRKCRLLCIDEKSIAAYNKRPRVEDEMEKAFDFSSLCMFCTEVADQEFVKAQTKYPIAKRIFVNKVRKDETQNKILEAATTHNDE